MNDESRLRALLTEGVPEPPPVPGRADGARAQAARLRRRRVLGTSVGAAAATAMVLVPLVLIGHGPASRPQPGTPSPTAVAGDFACPAPWVVEDPAPPNPALDGPTTLPAGAIAVRLCDGRADRLAGSPPYDALTTRVDQVIADVNRLPVQEPCQVMPMDLGPTLALSFQYPDGHRQVVQLEHHGCGGVTVGGQVRGGRATAWRPIELFERLLLRQRAGTTPPDLVAPLGCGDPDGWIASRRPPLGLTRARLCWRYQTESAQRERSAPIPTDDLDALLDDMDAHTTHDEITEDECLAADVQLAIVGQNAWGDRILLDGYCGAFNLTADNGTIWRPSPQSRAILDRLTSSEPLTLADPDAGTPPGQVVALWADLLNTGQAPRAAALWDVTPIASGGTVELKVEEVRRRPDDPGSPPVHRRDVVALYRVVSADGSWVDYHSVTFHLSRLDDARPWRITGFADHGVEPTGR